MWHMEQFVADLLSVQVYCSYSSAGGQITAINERAADALKRTRDMREMYIYN